MATYGKVKIETQNGTLDDVLVLTADSETREYHLRDVITLPGKYIFTVWYRAASSADITFDVFGESETVNATTAWAKFVKRVEVEDVTDAEITITTAPGIATYFYEGFCVNGQADTSWYPSDLDVEEYGKTATRYLTSMNNGVYVHPEGTSVDPTDTSAVGVLIQDAVDIIRDGKVRASYDEYAYFYDENGNEVAKIGETSRIGKEDGTYVLIGPERMAMIDNFFGNMFDVRATDGTAQFKQEVDAFDYSSDSAWSRTIKLPARPASDIVNTGSQGFSALGITVRLWTVQGDVLPYPTYWTYSYDQDTLKLTLTIKAGYEGPRIAEFVVYTYVNRSAGQVGIGEPDMSTKTVFAVGHSDSEMGTGNALELDAAGDLDLGGGLYTIQGAPIMKFRSIKTAATTIASGSRVRCSASFEMPAPYTQVIGIRQITTNHQIVTTINGYGVDGDGASGNTVTVYADVRNLGSSDVSEIVTFELFLAITTR